MFMLTEFWHISITIQRKFKKILPTFSIFVSFERNLQFVSQFFKLQKIYKGFYIPSFFVISYLYKNWVKFKKIAFRTKHSACFSYTWFFTMKKSSSLLHKSWTNFIKMQKISIFLQKSKKTTFATKRPVVSFKFLSTKLNVL